MQPDAQLPGIETLPPEDQEAIGTTLGRLLGGFQARDVRYLRGVYSAEARWVNAFRTVLSGSDAILEYLDGLFADVNFD